MNTIQKSNIEIPRELISWSRWMIGINFSAGTGCVVVFRDIKSSGADTISFWLMNAIILFTLTVLTSVIFNLLLSMELGNDFTLKNKHRFLGGLQLTLFSMALFSLVKWIVA
ncbi:hypothetical protein IFO69_14550 [Echinicola sp. CAU 1574]|uniref:Uncharacterized protein n=1 Tax=Echinicola arenosa TaxID=2774144 RepID=A0ABR9AME3_9BACT|nr:hypothetical protein [Echinicola arenosa]MBD8489974.1 hypothetical protein [Echinicola arenosa]